MGNTWLVIYQVLILKGLSRKDKSYKYESEEPWVGVALAVLVTKPEGVLDCTGFTKGLDEADGVA